MEQLSPMWKVIVLLNVITGCTNLSNNTCNQMLPIVNEISLYHRSGGILNTFLCRLALIQPHWRAFQPELPVQASQWGSGQLKVLAQTIQNFNLVSYWLSVFHRHGFPDLFKPAQAETSVQKANSNANRSSRQMEETITDFQRQKLSDVKVSNFVSSITYTQCTGPPAQLSSTLT